MNLEANLHSLLSFAWTLAPQIICDKILFSHTRRWYEFLFLYFFLFRFFVILRYLLIFTKNIIIVIIIIIIIIILLFFFMKIIFIFSCSGMFRNVPACSGMFHVTGFIDALEHYRSIKNALFSSSGYAGIGRGKVWKQLSSSSDL